MLPDVRTARHSLSGVQPFFLLVCALAAGPLTGCSDETAPNGGRSTDPSEQTGGEKESEPSRSDAGLDAGSMPPIVMAADAGMTPASTDAGTTPASTDAMAASDSERDAQVQAADASDASAPMADCTEVSWKNPGMVPNPKLVAIAEGAGKTGKPFEQRAGLDAYDYEMREFLFTGSSPAYTTRLTVRRPKDPAKYSGTVFVEWYNVSGGIDFAVLWANSREYFMREGHVFVGVSAQAGGANALKDYDAERYRAISHPGDDAANTIFSQAGVAVRTQAEMLLGPCMPVHGLLAVGQSQSGFRLADYVNNAHTRDKVYDAFMIHSGREPASNDPGVPTFVVQTMSEGNGTLSDGPTLVKWVVAGATHNDKRVTTRGAELGTDTGQSISACRNPMNEFPSYRVYNAALDWLERWARKGEKPPAGKPFESSGSALALDSHGNVRGGVRIQDIDAPIATYGTDNGPVDPLDIIGYLACGFGGVTIPFTPAKLLELYPTHDDYLRKYTEAADKALANGYLLQADYDESVMQAKAAPVPK